MMRKLTPVQFYLLVTGVFIAVAVTALWLFNKVSRNIQYISTIMKTSDKGKSLIKNFEGLRLNAYQDSTGVWTIGYGHTGKDVYAGLTITKEHAEILLGQDISIHESPVQNMGVELSQNQFDALVSFVFNVGVNAFRASTLYKKVLANPNDATIANEFRKWIYAGNTKLPGLVSRREKEAEMYFA
jgi:lysozyme